MNKQVFPLFRGDEAVTFVVIEPLYNPYGHAGLLLKLVVCGNEFESALRGKNCITLCSARLYHLIFNIQNHLEKLCK
jgi:hypothetical protein